MATTEELRAAEESTRRLLEEAGLPQPGGSTPGACTRCGAAFTRLDDRS